MSVTDQEGRMKSIEVKTCEICDEVLHTSFTDYHAQATCNICGATYMLWGKSDDEYPLLDLNPEFKIVFKEYWDETGERCRLGTFVIMRDYSGVPDEQLKFTAWLKDHHPEWLSDGNEDDN